MEVIIEISKVHLDKEDVLKEHEDWCERINWAIVDRFNVDLSGVRHPFENPFADIEEEKVRIFPDEYLEN